MKLKISNILLLNYNFLKKRKKTKKGMPGELASDEVPNDQISAFRVIVFRVIFDNLKMTLKTRYGKNEELFQTLAYFDPKRFKDINNRILTINETSLKFISQMAEIDVFTLREELYHFASSYDNLMLSAEGKFLKMVNDSEAIYQDNENKFNLDFINENEVKEVEDSGDDDDDTELEDQNPGTESADNDTNVCKSCIPCAFNLLHKFNFHTSSYSNLYLAYKYILTLACTQVNCERAFSKLKIIKNRLRSSMSQHLLESFLLGFIFDSDMSFSDQINSVSKSCHFHIRDIRRIRHLLPLSTATALANSLVSSKLDYCNSLYSGISQTSLNKLQRIQNSLARVITNTSKYQHITPTLKKLHWLPIRQRIDYKICLLTYKTLTNQQPTYLYNSLSFPSHSVSTRSSDSLVLSIPYVRSSLGKRAFSVIGPRLWNSLPPDTRNSSSLPIFRSRLKTHLFKIAFPP